MRQSPDAQRYVLEHANATIQKLHSSGSCADCIKIDIQQSQNSYFKFCWNTLRVGLVSDLLDDDVQYGPNASMIAQYHTHPLHCSCTTVPTTYHC